MHFWVPAFVGTTNIYVGGRPFAGCNRFDRLLQLQLALGAAVQAFEHALALPFLGQAGARAQHVVGALDAVAGTEGHGEDSGIKAGSFAEQVFGIVVEVGSAHPGAELAEAFLKLADAAGGGLLVTVRLPAA